MMSEGTQAKISRNAEERQSMPPIRLWNVTSYYDFVMTAHSNIGAHARLWRWCICWCDWKDGKVVHILILWSSIVESPFWSFTAHSYVHNTIISRYVKTFKSTHTMYSQRPGPEDRRSLRRSETQSTYPCHLCPRINFFSKFSRKCTEIKFNKTQDTYLSYCQYKN